MSPLEAFLWLELIRLRAEYVHELLGGIEALAGGVRFEFPEIRGCDPDGDRWIGHRMPEGWEEELEATWRRIEARLDKENEE